MTAFKPGKWTEGADVVVVGYGGAGAITAITAHDAGVKVIILEKQPSDSPIYLEP
jgi:flavin-dependent dehydrogenase